MPIIIYVLLLILSYSSQFGMRAARVRACPSQAMRIANRVIHQRARLIETQHQLLRIVSKIPAGKLKPVHISPLVNALARQNVLPKLAAHESLIEHSITQFINTPGFMTTLQRLIGYATSDANNFKGTLHELEQALKIAKNNSGERITGINQQVYCPKKETKKEFDIRTNLGLIECKNIFWPASPTHANHLRAQFEQQYAIVQLLNAGNEHELYFRICSKERIPNAWCQWFEDQGISYSW